MAHDDPHKPNDPFKAPSDDLDGHALPTAALEDDALSDAELRQIRLNDYIDGELDDDERAALEAELERDAQLRAELRELRDTLGALQGLAAAPQPAPEAFAMDVERRIRTRSRGRFFDDDIFYRTRIPFEIFAVVAIVLLGALYFFGNPPAPNFGDADDVAAMGGEPLHKDTPRHDDHDQRDDPAEATPSDEAHEEAHDDDSPKDAPGPDEGDGSDAQGDRAPRGHTPPAVVPLRREVIAYTLRLIDSNPEARAATIARQLNGMSRHYKVSRTGQGKLQVDLPTQDVSSVLSSFGKGARVSKMRIYVNKRADAQRTTVHIQVSHAKPTNGGRRPDQAPPFP